MKIYGINSGYLGTNNKRDINFRATISGDTQKICDFLVERSKHTAPICSSSPNVMQDAFDEAYKTLKSSLNLLRNTYSPLARFSIIETRGAFNHDLLATLPPTLACVELIEKNHINPVSQYYPEINLLKPDDVKKHREETEMKLIGFYKDNLRTSDFLFASAADSKYSSAYYKLHEDGYILDKNDVRLKFNQLTKAKQWYEKHPSLYTEKIKAAFEEVYGIYKQRVEEYNKQNKKRQKGVIRPYNPIDTSGFDISLS